MWINSLGLPGTYVSNLFDDVRDGLLLLRVMDHVKPGVVCWTKVNMQPRMVFKRVENANYAVVRLPTRHYRSLAACPPHSRGG